VYTSLAGAHKIINALGGKGFAFEITDDLTSDKAQHAYEELTHG
jgi:hypothetical protein